MAEGDTILGGTDDGVAAAEAAKTVEAGNSDADTAAAAEVAKAAEAAKATGAPEAYGDFTFPEAFEPNVDQVKAFAEVAKKHGLTQEQAQELLNVQSRGSQNHSKAQTAAWDKIKSDWYDTTVADKGIDLVAAKSALEKIATPALRELFQEMGIGNNPEIVRAFAKMGDLITRFEAATGEDVMDLGRTSAAPGEKTAAQIIYPDN